MTLKPELENYLSQLDKALNAISVSEKAEIITEIKSHILDASERSPDKALSEILNSLGTADQVANRYLIERGLATKKPSRNPLWAPFFKWTAFTMVGIFALMLIFSAFVMTKFSPLIDIDGNNGHLRILGGLINIDDKEGVSIGDINGGKSRQIIGVQTIDSNKIKGLLIRFKNGKFTLETTEEKSLGYNCKVNGFNGESSDIFVTENDKVVVKLDTVLGVNCALKIPKGLATELNGGNGKVDIQKPQFPLSIEIGNGKIQITPKIGELYHYNLDMGNGKMDAFESSKDPKALNIKVSLGNGVILKGTP